MGVFGTRYPAFARFLRDLASSDPGSGLPRIEARNFLLDPAVGGERCESYGEAGAEAGFGDSGGWLLRHEDYLAKQVYLRRPRGAETPKRLDPERGESCPETFRYDDNFTEFGAVDKGLHLVRVLDLGAMLKVMRQLLGAATVAESRIVEAAVEVARHWPEVEKAGAEARSLLEGILGAWNGVSDLRPAYASFFAEHESLLGGTPDSASGAWADRLRDRLGLAHLDPGARGPIHILVFRYPVTRVPTRLRLRGRRPLATPTVLDSRWSRAFCPSPPDHHCGRVVDLAAELNEPASEVVPPHFDLDAKDLFRVGRVTKSVPEDLWEARQAHLLWLRERTGHPDYAADTDPELGEPAP